MQNSQELIELGPLVLIGQPGSVRLLVCPSALPACGHLGDHSSTVMYAKVPSLDARAKRAQALRNRDARLLANRDNINLEDVAQVFVGNVLTCVDDETLPRKATLFPHQVLAVDRRGYIVYRDAQSTSTSQKLLQLADVKITKLPDDAWLMSGFVDTHIHAPQYLNAGTALDRPLEQWLVEYTYKAETRIDRDPKGLGRRVYAKLVSRMIEQGTTLASTFGTLTAEANWELARQFHEQGARAHIGKVMMDRHGVDGYVETLEGSLKETTKFINGWPTRFGDDDDLLVEPVLTPRFEPTCTSELLSEVQRISNETGIRIQSHMCESAGQVAWSKQLLSGKTDVSEFNELGLLKEGCLMAHCTHADFDDLDLLARTGASISHCPLSNVYFSAESQLALREALQKGVAVGIGSDISGGYALGIDNSMRWAVGVSRLREGQRDSDEPASLAITWDESLYLATLGGAKAMTMDHVTGSLEVGKSFDAQLIRLGRPRSRIDIFDEIGSVQIEELVEKWWCNGTEADREAVWVKGRQIFDSRA
ncbi:hypothetical protein OIV83_005291 [Microbotryomycetes sp. JL201]|nr:hypothetical protein OIV83_005291 [Microbotryomycetes sp. JL201]